MACAVWVAHTKHFTPKKNNKGGRIAKKESAILFWSVVFCFLLFLSLLQENASATPFRAGKGGKRSLERGKQTGRTEAEREREKKRNTRGLAGEMREGRHRREIRGRGREGGRVRRNRSSRRGGRERGRV